MMWAGYKTDLRDDDRNLISLNQYYSLPHLFRVPSSLHSHFQAKLAGPLQ